MKMRQAIDPLCYQWQLLVKLSIDIPLDQVIACAS